MICTQCKKDLPNTAFNWKNTKAGVRSTTCRDCKKIQQNSWYARNKTAHIKNVADGKKEARQWFRNYKQTLTCSRCPESNPVCLDFHHKHSKDNNVATMVSQGASIGKLIKEIAKCEVVCANCHRKIHASVVQR